MILSSKELAIIEAGLDSLLDNFMYEPEDYSDLAIDEDNIRNLIVKISQAGKELQNDSII